jgi:hypothetical protein
MNSTRMTEARKAAWERKNEHIISAFANLKEERVTVLERAYLVLHQSVHDMRERGGKSTKRKREEKEETKATKREAAQAAKEARKEEAAHQEQEKAERKAKEKADRIAANAQVRAKTAGELIDLHAAKVNKVKGTEEDLQLNRQLMRVALQVLTQVSTSLPTVSPPVAAGSLEEDDKENEE